MLPSRCDETRALLNTLPDWFRDLGTAAGIERLEQRIKYSIPDCLRLFYRFPATGCWLLAHADTDILLEVYPLSERPPVVRWDGRPHLVLAEFPHSEAVCAVELDSDNPRILWGYDGAQAPMEFPPVDFVEWLSGAAQKIIDSELR